MTKIKTKSAREAVSGEVFFDKNTNKISFKDENGIVTIINQDASPVVTPDYTEMIVKGFWVAQEDGTITTEIKVNTTEIPDSAFNLLGNNGNYGTLDPITELTNSNCTINKIAPWTGDYTDVYRFGNNNTSQFALIPYIYDSLISFVVLNTSNMGVPLKDVVGEGGRFYFEIEIFE
jgi:hypothetical protein